MSRLADILDYFFSPSRPISLVVNAAIVLIAAHSLLQLWRRGFRSVRLEQRGLDEVRSYLTASRISGGRVEETMESPLADPLKRAQANNALRIELERCSNGLANSPLVQGRIKNLASLQRQGDEIDHDALAAIIVSRLDGPVSVTRWAISAVVLLGLTGTLLGLTQAVRAAAVLLGNASGATVSQAITAVTRTFDGVQVAFSTTLAGAVCAIGLGMAVAYVRRNQGRFLADFEEFTAVALIPAYRTSAGLSLAQTAQKVAALEERLRETLSRLLGELERRGDHLANTVEQRFDLLTNEFSVRTERLITLFSETQSTVGKLLGEPGAEVPALTEVLTAVQRGVTELRAAVETASTLIPALEESISRQIDQQTADINEAVHAYTGEIEKHVTKQSDAIETGMSRFDELIPELGETIARGVDQQTSDINAALHAHAGEVANRLERDREEVRRLGAVLAAFNTSVGKLCDVLDAAQSSLVVNNEQVQAGVTQIQDLRTDLKELLSDLARRLDDVTASSPPRSTEAAATVPTSYEDGLGKSTYSPGSDRAGGNGHRPAGAPADDVAVASALPVQGSRGKNLWQRWFGRGR
jgi:hypothetical protein